MSMRAAREMDEDPARSGLELRDLLGLGGVMVAAVVAGMGLGWLVDDILDTMPVFILIGLAVGVAGGVMSCWVQIRRFLG
jgi:F0F1-type ATP synthase assembly protein I